VVRLNRVLISLIERTTAQPNILVSSRQLGLAKS
jgi:hypothetical protein